MESWIYFLFQIETLVLPWVSLGSSKNLPGFPMASKQVDDECRLQPWLLQGTDEGLLFPDPQLWRGLLILQFIQEGLNFFFQIWKCLGKFCGDNHPDTFPLFVFLCQHCRLSQPRSLRGLVLRHRWALLTPLWWSEERYLRRQDLTMKLLFSSFKGQARN